MFKAKILRSIFAGSAVVGFTAAGGCDLIDSIEEARRKLEGKEDELQVQACSDVLFAANEACLGGTGDLDGNGEIDEGEFELISYCWQEVANPAFDACCLELLDESCEVGDDPGQEVLGCADVLFKTNEECLGGDGDVDGNGEIDEVEIEAISYCWQEVANPAFDACCAESPDESCNVEDFGEPGAVCSDVLFATNEACAGGDGDLDGNGEIDERELELIAYCWQEVANPAFEACCAETPDDSCGVEEGEQVGQTCADLLFTTNAECLGCDGDADGNGEIDEAEGEAIAHCWGEVANAAFDACCAETPDSTCQVE